MELYTHQQKFLDKNIDKSLLCWDTGTGKTRTAIEWARLKPTKKIIVICPKALKENWEREILKYDGPIDINKWSVISKEEFKRDWKKLEKATLIGDEAHYFAGMRNFRSVSQMAKSLYLYNKKHKTSRILLLTATPYLSTPWNIFMLAKHLGESWDYKEFKERFFEDMYIGTRMISKPKDDIQEAIAALVGGLGDIVKIEDCIDLPDQIFEFEKFKLTKEQDKAKRMITDVNPIVKFTKYHQIENGTLKSDGYTEDEFFQNDKIERILELCEQNDKVAIICRYNLQIDAIKEAIKKVRDDVYVIRGDVKDRDSITQMIEKSDRAVVLINASCSEGYELPSVGLIVFASLSFSYKDYKQMLGRFLRINKAKKNVYIHLTAEGIDEQVFEAVKRKEDFDVHIYDR